MLRVPVAGEGLNFLWWLGEGTLEKGAAIRSLSQHVRLIKGARFRTGSEMNEKVRPKGEKTYQREGSHYVEETKVPRTQG